MERPARTAGFSRGTEIEEVWMYIGLGGLLLLIIILVVIF